MTRFRNCHAGLVEAAEAGTLFLHDIGEIPSSIETLLLRLFRHKDFERVGELRVRQAATRIVVSGSGDFRWLRSLHDDASNKDIGIIRINVPPLRDRHADIHQHALANIDDRAESAVANLAAIDHQHADSAQDRHCHTDRVAPESTRPNSAR